MDIDPRHADVQLVDSAQLGASREQGQLDVKRAFQTPDRVKFDNRKYSTKVVFWPGSAPRRPLLLLTHPNNLTTKTTENISIFNVCTCTLH